MPSAHRGAIDRFDDPPWTSPEDDSVSAEDLLANKGIGNGLEVAFIALALTTFGLLLTGFYLIPWMLNHLFDTPHFPGLT